MPKPKSPSVWTPSSSGPRWTIVVHIARRTRSSTARPPRAYQPAIPHMLQALAFRLGRRGGDRPARAGRRGGAEHSRGGRHGPYPHAAIGAHRGEARAVAGERQALHGGSLCGSQSATARPLRVHSTRARPPSAVARASHLATARGARGARRRGARAGAGSAGSVGPRSTRTSRTPPRRSRDPRPGVPASTGGRLRTHRARSLVSILLRGDHPRATGDDESRQRLRPLERAGPGLEHPLPTRFAGPHIQKLTRRTVRPQELRAIPRERERGRVAGARGADAVRAW